MSEGKLSIFYVIATILVLLSLSMIVNGTTAPGSFDGVSQSVSSTVAGLLLNGEHHVGHVGDTLYDIYCFDHNEYFGLRS